MESAPPRRKVMILDAATRLFAERGYEGASMADLAELVGLRKASLFHHFPSKDALYAAVFERMVEQLGAPVMEAAKTPGSFPERLDTMTDAICGALSEQKFAARLAVREMMDWGPYARESFKEKVRPVLGAAEDFVRAGQSAGVFNDGLDAKHLVLTLVSLYFMPFAMGVLVEDLTGAEPFSETFLRARCTALKAQLHRMMINLS